MALSGTEADIINTVARLRQATKNQIRKGVGFSLNYIGFLCQYLIRRGYLNFAEGYYLLAKDGIKTLLREEPKIDRELIKEIAAEIAGEISGELRKAVEGIKIPVKEIRTIQEGEERTEREAVKIKTDFEFPIEDESSVLESNINKIGAKLEKEKSDIKDKIELLKKLRRRDEEDEKRRGRNTGA